MKLTELGKRIKVALMEQEHTQTWLVEEVKARTGLYFDDWYLHRILTGQTVNTKIINAITEILSI